MVDEANGHDGVVDFHHPYEPYPIQQDLMSALYNCIEQGNIGIFESPTGTGKSLSLLCGSLTWLRNHKRAAFANEPAAAEAEDEPDWMREHAVRARKQELLHRRDQLENRLNAVRERESKIRRGPEGGLPPAKRTKLESHSDHTDDYMLDDYNSEDDFDNKKTGKKAGDGLSSETRDLLKRLGLAPAEGEAGAVDEDEELKIFICSRTHSQLSQLVGELHRVNIPSAFPVEDDESKVNYPIEQVKQLSLGSRKNLCINKRVANLPSVSQINEQCQELQDSKTPADRRCQYLPNKDNETLAIDFKHYALSRIRDIEDLAELGSKIGICPYYASRPAISPAELVLLPYPLLLQKTAREALAISVKDHVVIIDEAHNLMDAILGIYTAEITMAQLNAARQQLMTYLAKFRTRLAGKNRVYVTQTVRLLDSLIASLSNIPQQGEGVLDDSALLAGKGVDQINIYKLLTYLQGSKLARKVHGYLVNQIAQDVGNKTSSGETKIVDQTPVLNTFQTFILTLTNPAKEGRFFYHKTADTHGTKLRYVLLDPSQHFHDIVSSARSVILCGGTMSPISDYRTQLFPYLPPSRIISLSCSHVIPASNLHVTTLSTGPGSIPFDFSFSNRSSPALLRALGEALLLLLSHIPDGVILFFPSYAYLDTVVAAWRPNLLPRISTLKPTFIDSRNANTEHLLREYSTTITSPAPGEGKGALLLSVIGGKLSEGINFSDRLGRCVIVVGMPWPNPNGAEWKARMEYIEDRARQASLAATGDASTTKSRLIGSGVGAKGYVPGEASRDFAENVCMRAVNQAIGRVIRHKGDWAGIVLVDRRYSRESVKSKLPGWIRGSLRGSEKGMGDVVEDMRAFYERRSQAGGD
ncbi:hypothetical protein CAC42_1540 [Sphaceloma murrayae]|uniref:ATP-dependent DNA helicase CHL1 n=1 Tax=Sphaceloma murrayae TaxID=2082308 RepID=A0A2K1R313_9PEZI|nr:hypothetical protein CAC42_1540 [Sphaceloma murrayae]